MVKKPFFYITFVLPWFFAFAEPDSVELFGEKGRHARTAIGANLPLGVAVEIDGIFEVES